MPSIAPDGAPEIISGERDQWEEKSYMKFAEKELSYGVGAVEIQAWVLVDEQWAQ